MRATLQEQFIIHVLCLAEWAEIFVMMMMMMMMILAN